METINKKSIVARSRVRDNKGRFVKKHDMKNASGLNYQSAANSSFVALPEEMESPLSNPAVAPSAPGVYHVNTFRSIASTPGGMYRNLDESLRNCSQTAKAMLNDVSLTAPLFQRWMSLASYNDGLVPENENDPKQVAVCEQLMNDLNEIPRWTEFKRNLMWAAWYGKHVNVIDWEYQYETTGRKLKASNWCPLIGDKLVFRNNGRMGYLSHMPTGFRDVVYTDRGQAELFEDFDLDNLVHHKYFITDTTWDESQLAIGIEGFGYRHLLYWTYWLKMQLVEWAMNAFQIFGAGGIRIGYFEQSNPESQQQVADAMAAANGQNVILFPRPIGDEGQGAGIEIISPDGIGLDYFKNFIDDYYGKQISQMLLGYDFDAERKDYTVLQQYDANGLSETITNQLVRVLIKYNYPQAVNYGIKYQINVPAANTEEYLTSVQRAYELGLPLGETEVYASIGLTRPTKNKRIIQKTEDVVDNSEDRTIKTPEKEIGSLIDQLA